MRQPYPCKVAAIKISTEPLLAVAITALGGSIMLGWVLHIPLLVRVADGYVYTAFNTALCFVLLGASLLVPGADTRQAMVRRYTGAAIIAFSGIIFAQDFFESDWGIDQLLMRQDWLSNLSGTPGRMAPQTAVCFILSGIFLLFKSSRAPIWVNLLLPFLAVVVVAIAILSLTGYWLNLEVMYSWYHYTRMAPQTAIGFTLIGMSLWLSWYRLASDSIFRQREDRRISAIAAALLTIITLTAGMSGFALMARQMEDSLKSSFDAMLQNQYRLIQFVLTEETGNAHAISHYLLMNRLVNALNTNPDAAEERQTLATVVNSVMARNYSGIALYGLDGKKLVETGSFVRHADVSMPLDAQNRLLWENGAVLHSAVDLFSEDKKVGMATVERKLPAIDDLLLNNRYVGASDEIVLCAANGESLVECLPSRNHPHVFVHQPRVVNGKPLMMDYALRGEQGVHTGTDYAGNIVIAACRLLEPYKLGVVMKMNAGELYNPVRDKLANILLLIAVLVVCSILALRSKLVPLVRQLVSSEREAKASKARVQAIMENVAEGIITLNDKGMIETFNPAIARIFGYATSELVGQNIKLLMPQRMRSMHQEGMDRYMQRGTNHVVGKGALELPGLHKDGHELVLMLTVTEMWLEEKRFFVGSIRDVSAFKESQEALRISEERLHLATSGTSDGLWDWNVLSGALYHSPRFQEMLGYGEEEQHDHIEKFLPLIHPDDIQAMREEMRNHFSQHTPYDVEYRVRHRHGHYLWVNSRGQALWDAAGKAVRMTGFVTDISQRKEVERIKNEFVSTVSHELRTPLTSIRGSLGLILSGIAGEMNDKMRGLVDIAHKNCERLILLINDILDVEKIASGQMRYDLQWISIRELLMQALELNRDYGEKYQVRFVIKGQLHDTLVHVDGDRLNQVLSNLLSNAAKFSPPGSDVEIFTEERSHVIRVSIANTGPGIPEAFHARIFGKFAQADSSTTKQKGGTGLGLNISKTIIEYFGGQIGFTSRENETVFYFDLPKTHTGLIQYSGSNARLLVCEDDPDIATLLKTILEQLPFDIDIALTAAEARELLATRSYAAMTLDMTLPDEDGANLLRTIRNTETGRDLPIIVVTAKGEEGKKELNGYAIGIVDWLTKPLDTGRLVQAVSQLARHTQMPVILHVEDDEDVVQVVKYGLQAIARLVHVSTLSEAQAYLAHASADLILLDLSLPDGSGLQLLDSFNAMAIPVIIFSASEVSRDIGQQVSAVLVKSRASDSNIIATITRLIEKGGES